MSCSSRLLKRGSTTSMIGVIKGDTRSLDYGSCWDHTNLPPSTLAFILALFWTLFSYQLSDLQNRSVEARIVIVVLDARYRIPQTELKITLVTA